MIFEQIAVGGCQSYLVGCADTLSAVLIDPEISQGIDRYQALASRDGLHIRYVIDTHTHADHFSAAKLLAEMLDVPAVAHALPAPPLREPAVGRRRHAAGGRPAYPGDPHAGPHPRFL